MILATGATGNIGAATVTALRAPDGPVRVVSRSDRDRPTVPDLLGRPARSFATWAAEHADAFR